ncbi:V-type ATP synthase subunit I [Candidatus Woesearchaeota archaeon]|nr:V-type ATP synthase subunit I [Candidatus Woesearchaeota archaeon]
MMPERMAKIRIIAPKSSMERIVKELYELKALHITEGETGLDAAAPAKNAETTSGLLVTTRALIANLGIRSETRRALKHDTRQAERQIATINKETSENLESLKQTEEKIRAAESIEAELEKLSAIDLPISSYSSYKSLSVFTGTAKNTETLTEELLKATDRFELHTSADRKTIALFIEAPKKATAQDILARHDFTDINITPGLNGTAHENLKRTRQEKEGLIKKAQAIREQLNRIRDKSQDLLLAEEQSLAEELEKAEAPMKFGTTKSTFIATGWVPENKLTKIRHRLERVASEKIHIEQEYPEEDENVPVKLSNTRYARPFEFLINLRGLPLYNETDPTLAVFLTFPIFFGFMLGDIGYGLVTVAASLALKARYKTARSLLTVIALSGATSVIFGFVFGEFFGEEQLWGTELPRLISRTHGTQELLMASIAFGIIHINTGLAIGFLNELRHHGALSAILEKASWVLIQLGGVFILSALGIMDAPATIKYASAASLTAGVTMLAAAELKTDKTGPLKAAVESITIFSNIMSYSRLMAVGISSVQLALIVNEFAKEAFRQGGPYIALGVIILATGHAVNTMLGLLGAFLHSLRLEYVEFFTKFFKGGAEPYKPFGEKS